MKLIKNPSFDKPIFVSGLTRSGKILLCELLTCFENSEKVNVDFTLEQIPELLHLEKLSLETARYLVTDIINQKYYYNLLSRDANFRKGDYTSIWNFHDPYKYIKRTFSTESNLLSDKYRNNQLFHLMLHNGLWHSDVFFEAYPKLAMFHMIRNPVDIIFSWLEKGYEGTYYQQNKIKPMCLTYDYKGQHLPYYSFGWEEEFIEITGADRVVLLIEKIREFHFQKYSTLPPDRKKQILFVDHENLATNTLSTLSEIGNFLDASLLKDKKKLKKILIKLNCPRKISQETRLEKIEKIKQKTSIKMFKRFESMVEKHVNRSLYI